MYLKQIENLSLELGRKLRFTAHVKDFSHNTKIHDAIIPGFLFASNAFEVARVTANNEGFSRTDFWVEAQLGKDITIKVDDYAGQT
jgi:hypothetical protein